VVSVKEGTVEASLGNCVRDLRTLTHLCIVKGHSGEIRNNSLSSILLEILIYGGIDQVSNCRFGGINNLRNDGTLQERDQDVSNL